ncbi:MAG: UvrD/REP helicase, DNA helicase II / ATP-dependent DNA helicase PcrA [Candidatus Gottesmanbacteria bacterium GW2011_GWA2_43_14]|uniref:DNA 3'-5' helicase n=1 Tax=Candidatus Gottesmanbacteria bacterium GW2011_GWA2_43_14 TaxID=1618443 RepID=A0A0G1DK54_9BACT|nr:MAG: UvrD/REP helicase, DNA helicase II / ATP-dependent DNA helicase PcrA [Candidatus Gottesmanbacteria bacterium GW2011_GWA2_43_14]
MENNLLEQLNPDQQTAVKHIAGPSLILAGAGSGKTRVLTFKVAYLVSEGIRPENILMVTFTNKAAREMQDRIRHLLKISPRSTHGLPLMTTFHSLSARLLRLEGKHIGIPVNFLIYDDIDTREAVIEAMNKLSIDKKSISPNAVAATISQAKNELIDSVEYQSFARGYFQEEVARLYPVYQEILRENRALDFEDLIFTIVRLFQNDKQILEKYRRIFQFILVDEYQDTNKAQYELVKLLAGDRKNLTVVGDASQSIYAWRGADYRNINRFQQDFPETAVYHLEKNYRSSQNILDAAHAVISKNITHPILKLWTDKGSGYPIRIYEAANEHDEAGFIADELTGYRLSETAVLYRTNAQSRIIEEVLLHRGIPYILVGGTRFYERKEIKDVLAYLRLTVNPKESVSLKRAEKIGKRRLEKFFRYLEKNSGKKNAGKNTLTLLDEIMEATFYPDLYDKKNPEELARLENIKELRSVASEFPDIDMFLENVALIEQEYTPDVTAGDAEGEKVTLMTMHAAKGLEFKTIFLVGMEEGLFPHSMTLMDPDEIEEERRLCYVGLTRAKEKLYLTYARRRLYFGQRSQNMVSRFLSEIPENLLERTYHDFF